MMEDTADTAQIIDTSGYSRAKRISIQCITGREKLVFGITSVLLGLIVITVGLAGYYLPKNAAAADDTIINGDAIGYQLSGNELAADSPVITADLFPVYKRSSENPDRVLTSMTIGSRSTDGDTSWSDEKYYTARGSITGIRLWRYDYYIHRIQVRYGRHPWTSADIHPPLTQQINPDYDFDFTNKKLVLILAQHGTYIEDLEFRTEDGTSHKTAPNLSSQWVDAEEVLYFSGEISNDQKHLTKLRAHYKKDKDECTDGSAQCHVNADCITKAEGYECKCKAGFEGNGKTCCTDKDECTDGSAQCHVNADCTNTAGGYECKCKAGFEGNGKTCTDKDECTDGSAQCYVTVDCINTAGGYECKCKAGFEGNGKNCTDKDECTDGSAQCHVNADCINTAGGFECKCKEGFLGDGKTCTVLRCYIHQCNGGEDPEQADCKPGATTCLIQKDYKQGVLVQCHRKCETHCPQDKWKDNNTWGNTFTCCQDDLCNLKLKP